MSIYMVPKKIHVSIFILTGIMVYHSIFHMVKTIASSTTGKQQNDEYQLVKQREILLHHKLNYFYDIVENYLQNLIRYKLSDDTEYNNFNKEQNEHYSRLQKLKNELELLMKSDHFLWKNKDNASSTQNDDHTSIQKKDALNKKRSLNISRRKTIDISRNTTLQYSCKETYTGHTIGYPEYKTGFIREKCVRPNINKSVSIILDRPLIYLGSDLILNETIEVASRTFQRVDVLLGNNVCEAGILNKIPKKQNVEYVCVDQKHLFGTRLNAIISRRNSSPFVVVAPRIGSLNYPIDVERMLHIHETTNATIVGTAIKDLREGKWNRGCFQSSLHLYELQYIPGYQQSIVECLKCDFIPGPFLSTVKFLKNFKFGENLSEAIYEDFFLRMKTHKKLVLACPDIMTLTYQYKIEQRDFKTFVDFWDVFFLRHYTQIEYRFDCPKHSKKQMVKRCRVPKGIATPPCCLVLLREGLHFVMRLCQKYKLECEIQEGTVLGAVKFHGMLPWEQDADVSLSSRGFLVLKSLESEFVKKGYQLIIDHEPKCCTRIKSSYGGIAHIRVYHWSIQLYGRSTCNKIIRSPTLMKLGNTWVNGPENPGLYVRNRYGYKIYKHAEHWIINGGKNGWIDYDAGRFEACPKPGHHSCLDNFAADGDFPFLGSNTCSREE